MSPSHSPELSYSATSVSLGFTRNDVAFATYATSRNMIATAEALDALSQDSGIYGQVVTQDASGAAQAFNALSGEVHASLKGAMIEASRFVRDIALAPVDDGLPRFGGAMDAGGGLRARGSGDWGRAGGNDNAAGLGRATGGVMLGAYGGAAWGGVGMTGGAVYGVSDIDTTRNVAFGTYRDRVKGLTDGLTGQVFGEVNFTAELGRTSLQPFAGLACVSFATEGYGDHGGDAALKVRGDTTDSTFSTLGMRLGRRLDLAHGGHARLSGSRGWRHAHDATMPTAENSFAGGAGFTVEGTPIAGDAAVLTASVTFDLGAAGAQPGARTRLAVAYSGQYARDASDNAAGLHLKISF